MYDETTALQDDDLGRRETWAGEAQPIADVLAELLAKYQELTDQLLRVDGKEGFTVYLAPVGKV